MTKFGLDGREFTDYRPTCVVENVMKRNVGAMSNYEYRMYLQRNGLSLIQAHRNAIAEKNKKHCNCPQCIRLSNK